jgi:hypothetical protein
VRARRPPVHSVTSLPVISTWMPPAWVPSAAMHGEEAAHFPRRARRAASCSRWCLDGVAVHGVAGPHHDRALALHGADESGRCFSTLSAPKRRSASGGRARSAGSASSSRISSSARARAALEADRVLDAAAELDMGVVRLAGAVADPQHVAGGGVPVAAGGIDAGQRLLVAEQQRLVAGVEIGGAQLRCVSAVMPQARMKPRASSMRSARSWYCSKAGESFRKPRSTCGRCQVGIAALGEGAQQVQRRGDWR